MLLPLLLLAGGGLLAGHSGLVNEGEQLAEPTADNFFSYLDKARTGDPASRYAVTRALMKHDYGERGAAAAPWVTRFKRMTDPERFAKRATK
jgi:hypothetical protein